MKVRIGVQAVLLAGATLLLSLLPVVPALAQQTTDLTVDDVITMAKSGLSENVVLARIRAENKSFKLTTDDMIRLKKAGVSDRIMEAMLAPTASASGSAGASNPIAGFSGVWNGTLTNEGKAYQAKLLLSQTGSNLVGSLTIYNFHGVGALPISITSGVLTGNALSFAGQSQLAGGSIQMDFSGSVEGASIRGKLNFTVSSLAGTGTEASDLQVLRASSAEESDATGPERPANRATENATAPAKPASVDCGDFDACLRAGHEAFVSHNWTQALPNLLRATAQRPESGEAWVWIGKIYLATGRFEDFPAAWDKALNSGFILKLTACHERSFHDCELGTLQLNRQTVSYVAGGQIIFSAAPSEVSVKGLNAYNGITLRIGSKNYSLLPYPVGVECGSNVVLVCPQQGIAQQQAIANYLAQAIPKLASGALSGRPSTAISSTPPAPAAPALPVTMPASNALSCSSANDSGYSISLFGHVYKVKAIGSAGVKQVPVFFDKKGVHVTEPALLTSLAEAAWTRENIVASPAARSELANKGKTISAIIETSRNIIVYEAAQDLLARAMTEAILGGLTGGASLDNVVPRLALSFVRGQLKSAGTARTILALTAQYGLQRSLAEYNELSPLLPPPQSAIVDADTLAKIRKLYSSAQAFDFPGEALAAALMPQHAADLRDEAVQSLLDEVGAITGMNEQVTYRALLDWTDRLSVTAGGIPALQRFSENFTLALNLASANDRWINQWAAQSASICGGPDRTEVSPTAGK